MTAQGAASVPPASRRSSILTGLGIFASSGPPAGGATSGPTSTSAADPVGTLGLSSATPSLVGEPAFPVAMNLSNGSRDARGIDIGMGRPQRDMLDPVSTRRWSVGVFRGLLVLVQILELVRAFNYFFFELGCVCLPTVNL